MRHRSVGHQKFGRKPGPRKALLRGLVSSLVEHGRIKTTLPKAKELRRQVEKAITLGKKADLHGRRLLAARYPNQKTVSGLVDDLASRFTDRKGGYTRIIKLGSRPGDQAEMAFIEFVDYEVPEGGAAKKETPSDVLRARVREKARRKKHLRKIQQTSRRINRS